MGELDIKREQDGSPKSYAEEQRLVTNNCIEVMEGLSPDRKLYELPVLAILDDPGTYVILGFDTEYQQLEQNFTQKDVREKKAKYDVLSYQFYAINHLGEEWSGLIVPEHNKRIPLTDLIIYALAKGAEQHCSISKNVVLVGHYNKADIPAFDDRQKLFFHFKNIRNSLVTLGHPVRMTVCFNEETQVDLNIHLRDSILLAPASHQSVLKLGELIEVPKIHLAKTVKEELDRQQCMRLVRDYDWELFRRYAIRDAEVCAKYFLRVTEQYRAVTGSDRFPTALSSIGMQLLLKDWKEKRGRPVGSSRQGYHQRGGL